MNVDLNKIFSSKSVEESQHVEVTFVPNQLTEIDHVSSMQQSQDLLVNTVPVDEKACESQLGFETNKGFVNEDEDKSENGCVFSSEILESRTTDFIVQSTPKVITKVNPKPTTSMERFDDADLQSVSDHQYLNNAFVPDHYTQNNGQHDTLTAPPVKAKEEVIDKVEGKGSGRCLRCLLCCCGDQKEPVDDNKFDTWFAKLEKKKNQGGSENNEENVNNEEVENNEETVDDGDPDVVKRKCCCVLQ